MGWFSRLLGAQGQSSPEELIDSVITDLKRKLTEARLQMLAADVARRKLEQPSAESHESLDAACQGIEDLESKLHEMESRRDLLVARARDADARLAIERALIETDLEPRAGGARSTRGTHR